MSRTTNLKLPGIPEFRLEEHGDQRVPCPLSRQLALHLRMPCFGMAHPRAPGQAGDTAEAGQQRKRDEGRSLLSPGEERGVLDQQLVVQQMPVAQLLPVPALEKRSLWGFTSNI